MAKFKSEPSATDKIVGEMRRATVHRELSGERHDVEIA